MKRVFPHLILLAAFLGISGCRTAESRGDGAAIVREEPAASVTADERRSVPIEHPSDADPASAPSTPPDPTVITTDETQKAPESLDEPPSVVQPFPHIAIDLKQRIVEIEGFACLDRGWLEQVVCGVGTREHESLVVTEARASHIHAAMLLAGFEPGSPGRWSYVGDDVQVIPPQGDEVDIHFRYVDSAGDEITVPARSWIRDHLGVQPFPADPWVFGGSSLAQNPPAAGGGEYYVADYSGSIVGLVTFGDEVIGFSNVLADQEAVQPPEWEVDSRRVPPVGTRVTVLITPFKKVEADVRSDDANVESTDR